MSRGKSLIPQADNPGYRSQCLIPNTKLSNHYCLMKKRTSQRYTAVSAYLGGTQILLSASARRYCIPSIQLWKYCGIVAFWCFNSQIEINPYNAEIICINNNGEFLYSAHTMSLCASHILPLVTGPVHYAPFQLTFWSIQHMQPFRR